MSDPRRSTVDLILGRCGTAVIETLVFEPGDHLLVFGQRRRLPPGVEPTEATALSLVDAWRRVDERPMPGADPDEVPPLFQIDGVDWAWLGREWEVVAWDPPRFELALRSGETCEFRDWALPPRRGRSVAGARRRVLLRHRAPPPG